MGAHTNAYEKKLVEAFFFPVPVTGPHSVTNYRIKCRDCEKTWDFKREHGGLPVPGKILAKAQREGWFVRFGKKPRCPRHAVDPVRYRTITLEVPAPAPVVQPLKETTMSLETQIASPNMKLVRQVMNLLEEHFDEKQMRYKPSWSDEKIAKDSGLHIAQVAKIRVDAFGELADDPVVIKMRDDFAALELVAEQLLKDAKENSRRLEQYLAQRKFGG